MTIYGTRFIFANRTSDELGLVLCSINGSGGSSNDETSEVVTSKSPFKESWDLHYIEYKEPLRFTITVAKIKGGYFDSLEQEALKKWLCKNKREWLQVEQEDLMHVYYYCIISNPRPVTIQGLNAGFTFEVVCDTGHAWTQLLTRSYDSTVIPNFDFSNLAPYEDYILYPVAVITPIIDGNISIINNTTGKTVTINNCVTTEVITIDSKNDILESTNGRVLLDNWNKKFIEFAPGTNNISLTGAFNLELQYRLPVRVGG